MCLPPTFEGGRRLHQLPAPSVYWLEILLRQHEVCWRTPREPGELRVFVVGSSAVYGLPLAADETFTHRLNEAFEARGVAAHVFNLGFVTTYQLKDALILYAALGYEPDVIVYPMALTGFVHKAPVVFPGLSDFFQVNNGITAAMATSHPAGLDEPLQVYNRIAEHPPPQGTWLGRLQDVGSLVRRWVGNAARAGVTALGGSVAPPKVPLMGRQGTYDCAATRAAFERDWHDWKSWNSVAYLEQLQKTRGTTAVVVNWPVAHEPVDDCYDVRYPTAALEDWNVWLRDETRRRGLAYVDLHDALPADEFIDSIHVDAAGHRRIAERLEAPLAAILEQVRTRQARRTP
jgi:hypothetical protein